ncbi:MAG: hypothetical protein ACRDQ4_21390 [Pseudonocardiaceae bacterium]
MTLGSLIRPIVPPAARVGLIVTVALFVLAGECGLHRVMLPHRRAQVPSTLGRHHSRDAPWWDRQWQRHERSIRITLTLAAVGIVLS